MRNHVDCRRILVKLLQNIAISMWMKLHRLRMRSCVSSWVIHGFRFFVMMSKVSFLGYHVRSLAVVLPSLLHILRILGSTQTKELGRWSIDIRKFRLDKFFLVYIIAVYGEERN